MGEARCANLATIRLIGPIADEIDAKFALRRLNRRIDFAGRNVEPFGIELEVVDQRFHRALHLGPRWWRDLALTRRHGPLPVRSQKLLHALLHDEG